jgi:hypothetical protein
VSADFVGLRALKTVFPWDFYILAEGKEALKHKRQMYVDLQQFSFYENLPKAGRAELRRK